MARTKHFGMFDTGCTQDIGLSGITIVEFAAIVAYEIDLVEIAVNRGEGLVL